MHYNALGSWTTAKALTPKGDSTFPPLLLFQRDKKKHSCTLFLRPHKPSPSIIESHITAIFPFLSPSAWPFNWCLRFFSWMSSQHFRYHYSVLLLSLSFFITGYCTAFESLISIFQVAHNEGFIVFYWTSCAIAVAFTMLCHREEKI